jgi:plasmid replication initiation protein
MQRSEKMAKKKTQLVKGQVYFDFCMDKTNYVVQSNDLVGGRQSLRANSAKLVRACIMQTVKEDEELRAYLITIPKLAEMFGVDSSTLYRTIDNATNELMASFVTVKVVEDGRTRWKKINWVDICEYDSKCGLCIKLRDELKPYLLQLKANYTQYTLDEVLTMKSAYAIRIYELILSRIKQKVLPKGGITVQYDLKELKEACGIEDTKAYNTFANLKIKVLDVAVREINEKTTYNVSYEYIKQSRKVVGINFLVNAIYH